MKAGRRIVGLTVTYMNHDSNLPLPESPCTERGSRTAESAGPGAGAKWDWSRARKERPPLLHPLGGADVDTFLAHLRACQGPLSRQTLWQRLVTLSVIVARVPLSAWDRVRWAETLRYARLEAQPVFIVGHWRSGTTLLHQLISQDPQFCYPDFAQIVAPNDILGWIQRLYRFLIQQVLPADRGYDRVKLDLDAPQEEEIALAGLNPLSYYRAYYFPRQMTRHFEQSVLFKGVEPREREDFAHAYLWLAKMLTQARGRRRLLFKNPSSTARLALLKEVFPGAKFVYIHRNPYEVFCSSLNRYPRMMAAFAWETYEDIDYREMVFHKYGELLRSYLTQVDSIPERDRVETSFESITADPEREIRRIYGHLGLGGVNEAISAMRPYFQGMQVYERNRHEIRRIDVERIERDWRFSLERWPYGVPESLKIID